MDYSKGTPATYNYPMSLSDFQLAQETRIQNALLTDPEMIRESIRLRNNMARENHKSMLKQAEAMQNQQVKTVNNVIYLLDYGVELHVVNGGNCILRKTLLFSCRVGGMQRVFRAVTKARFWQVEGLANGDRIISELYPADFLKFPNRLKGTLLGRYDCSVGSGDMAIAWKWMQHELVKFYEETQETELPYLAGWFHLGQKWTFWIRKEENLPLVSDVIEKFTMRTFPSLDAESIADELFSAEGSFDGQENMGILLIFSAVALLSRLVTDSPLQVGLTLVGTEAMKIARACLCTMDTGGSNCDIVNLDADRMDRIQANLQILQDTSLVLVSSDPDNKSTKNRLSRIKSWIESGYVEGRRVTVPFVFCIRKISPLYPLDSTVVIMTDEITIPDGFEAFSKLWAFIVSTVEEGGDYWPKEFKRQYRAFEEDWDKDENFLRVCDTVSATVFEMLSLDKDRNARLNEAFGAGINSIENQLDARKDAIVEIFKSGVAELADAKKIVVLRICSDATPANSDVYYDEEFYYFPKGVMGYIQEELEFDRKAMLFIKQTLAADGFVKQYRTTGTCRSELEIDIWIGTGETRERYSVFAVKRCFWDEFGGIPLCER